MAAGARCKQVEQILEASTWEAKPANLQTFLSGLKLRGGMGEEAIEVGLMHALSEHSKERPISQIVLIGDAGANTAKHIREKRDATRGLILEVMFSSSKFAQSSSP